MGMYAPDPPDPPKEYTAEKSAFAASELAKRKAEARAYNQQVNSFNNRINGFSGRIGGIAGRVGGFDILDDEYFGGARTQLTNMLGQLNGMNFNVPRPEWESTVNSAWGAVNVGMPSLGSADISARDRYIGQLNDLMGTLDNLMSERRAEENRVRNWSSQLFGDATSLGSRIKAANFGDLDILNNLRDEYGDINAQRKSFRSEILGDFRDPLMSRLDRLLSQNNTGIQGLFNQRDREMNRVNRYEQSIVNQGRGFGNRLAGLDINNLPGMEALQRAIDDYQNSVGMFKTQLTPDSYDFSQEMNQVQTVEDRLAQLFSKRDAEKQRVQQFTDQLNTAAMGIGSNARTADMYNLGTIDDLMAQIAMARDQMGGFSSKLRTDFGLATGQLDQAATLLEGLRNQRTSALDAITSKLDPLLGQIPGLADYDETGMDNLMNMLSGFGSQIGQFTGSDVSGLQQRLNTGQFDLQQRLNALSSKRAALEREAQVYLSALKKKKFGSLDDMTGDRDQATSMEDMMNQYNAQQGMDEIQAMMDYLDAEKARLEKDAQNVSLQQVADSLNPLGGTSSISDLQNQLTEEQYAALMNLSQRAAQGDTAALDQYNAFLRSLGVGV